MKNPSGDNEREVLVPGAQLPQAQEMERCVLGCMMQAPDYAAAIGMRLLKAGDFAVEAHGMLFELVMTQFNAGRPVDPATLLQMSHDRGLMEKVTPVIISECYTASPNPSHVEHYAREVLVKAKARRVVLHCWETANALMREPTEEVLQVQCGQLVDNILLNTRNADGAKIVHISEAIAEGMEELDHTIANRGHVTGPMASGFTDLDRMFITGFRPTENITIAGDTSMGKTSLAVQILENISTGTGHYRQFYDFDVKHAPDWRAEIEAGRARSRYGKQMVLLVCLESSQVEMALKLLMGRAEVNVQEIQRGMIGREAMTRLGRSGKDLQQSQFYIWDAAGVTVEELAAELKAFKVQNPSLAAVCVDHCGLLGARGIRDQGNETAICGYISNVLRNLWKKLEVVGFTLWQLNRDAAGKGEKGKPPSLRDLRSSGKIEQDATKVIMPFRPGHYSDEADESEAFLVIAKNRGGPRSAAGIQMRWDGNYTRFYSEQKDEDGQWRPRPLLYSLKESDQQVR